MNIVGIIPVRYNSTRLPGKPLAKILAKPMIQWVWEAASKSKLLNKVVIATDDERIFDCASSFGAKVIMTPECNSGSDRLAFACQKINCDIVVNIQGDEPLIKPEMIDTAVKPLIENRKILVSTLATTFDNEQEVSNPNNVKVIVGKGNFALYFSRYLFFSSNLLTFAGTQFLKHIGLYAFRKNFLMKFSKMEQTPLEISEKLEQLRILENGYKIYVAKTKHKTIGVDTNGDLQKVRVVCTAGCRRQ